MSYVYCICEPEGRPIKIGVSNNPDYRLRTLQSGNARPLAVAQTWRFENRDIAFEVERCLQRELSERAMVGEWIDASAQFISEFMPDFLLSEGIEEA